MKESKSSLRVTNYNNFKDLSYFVAQHKKALGMMEEVQNFYLSFLKSKLIHSYEISAWPGKLITRKKLSSLNIYMSKYSEKDHGKDSGDLYREIKKTYDNIVYYKAKDKANGFTKTELVLRRERAKKAIEKKIIGREITYKINKHDYDVIQQTVVGKIVEVKELKGDYWNNYKLDHAFMTLELNEPIYSYDSNEHLYNPRGHITDVSCSFSEAVLKIAKDKSYTGVEAYKEIYDMPDGQEMLKKAFEDILKEKKQDCWMSETPEGLILIDNDKDLSSYIFELGNIPNSKSKKEVLIISKTYTTSGNYTDRWKTFFEKIEHKDGMCFDISNGNFLKNFHTDKTIERRQLDVRNGWHPYEDD